MNLSANCSDSEFSDSVIYPVGATSVHVILAAFGLAGNMLVFIVFFRQPRLRMKTANIFLFNLAIADFCSSVFMAGRPYVFQINPETLFWREFVCRFFKSDFPLWTCVTASIYNLLLVTVDRYLCVVKPFLYRRYFTVAKIRLMVTLCWIFSAILETYCFYSTRVNACGSCEIHWPSKTLQIICTFATFFLTYLLPTTVMLFAYRSIVKTLKVREKALHKHRQPVAAGNLLRARRNVVRMLQLLVLMFGVLWAPNQILFLYLSFPGTVTGLSQLGFSVILMIGFLNCVFNPVVYAFKNPHFKAAFLAAVCCRRGGAIGPSQINPSDLSLDKADEGDSRTVGKVSVAALVVQSQFPPVDLPNQPSNARQSQDILDE